MGEKETKSREYLNSYTSKVYYLTVFFFIFPCYILFVSFSFTFLCFLWTYTVNPLHSSKYEWALASFQHSVFFNFDFFKFFLLWLSDTCIFLVHFHRHLFVTHPKLEEKSYVYFSTNGPRLFKSSKNKHVLRTVCMCMCVCVKCNWFHFYFPTTCKCTFPNFQSKLCDIYILQQIHSFKTFATFLLFLSIESISSINSVFVMMRTVTTIYLVSIPHSIQMRGILMSQTHGALAIVISHLISMKSYRIRELKVEFVFMNQKYR